MQDEYKANEKVENMMPEFLIKLQEKNTISAIIVFIKTGFKPFIRICNANSFYQRKKAAVAVERTFSLLFSYYLRIISLSFCAFWYFEKVREFLYDPEVISKKGRKTSSPNLT